MWHPVNSWKEDRKERGGRNSNVSYKESENEEFQKPPNFELQIIYVAPHNYMRSRLFLNIFLSRLRIHIVFLYNCPLRRVGSLSVLQSYAMAYLGLSEQFVGWGKPRESRMPTPTHNPPFLFFSQSFFSTFIGV